MIRLWIAFGLLMPAMLFSADRERVVGHWASESSIFEIALDEEALSGKVRALRDPLYLPDEDSARAGQPRKDDNNPDVEMRDRSIIGLAMFSEYQFEDGQWQGKIYDPESGNTYQSRMKINKAGDLEIRGYIGLPIFGRTATFVPVGRCTPDIRLMITQLEGQFPCIQDTNE